MWVLCLRAHAPWCTSNRSPVSNIGVGIPKVEVVEKRSEFHEPFARMRKEGGIIERETIISKEAWVENRPRGL